MPRARFDLDPARRSRRAIAAAFVIAFLATGSAAWADSVVNFWISPTVGGPEVPVLYVAPGSVQDVHVRARPATGYNMSAFSLNLVATNPGVVEFESVTVLNPVVAGTGGAHRHQLVFDTTTGLQIDPDGVRGFNGFSFFPGGGLPAGVGIGPECDGDPDCSDASGQPAWRLATISLSGSGFGSTPLYLQLGTQGAWQSPAAAEEPDPPMDTSAVFGLPSDLVHGWGADELDDLRNEHFGDPDAMVQVATADFDVNTFVDGADLLRWQKGLGVGDSLGEGDSNDDSDVDLSDLAAWKFQFGSTFAVTAVGLAIPEPQCSLTILAAAWLVTSGASRRRTPRAKVAENDFRGSNAPFSGEISAA